MGMRGENQMKRKRERETLKISVTHGECIIVQKIFMGGV